MSETNENIVNEETKEPTYDIPEYEEPKKGYTICVDKDGYYTTGEGTLVHVGAMPTGIGSARDLFSYKYNAETELLELDEVKAEEAKKVAFQELVEAKINELSEACQAAIVNGIDYDGNHYSYTLTDQNNLANAFQLVVATGMAVPYHADGMDCRMFTKEEIVAIYCEQDYNVTDNITYFNQLKQYVSTLTTEEEVKAVEYGQALTDEYLYGYNMIMRESEAVREAFIESQDA